MEEAGFSYSKADVKCPSCKNGIVVVNDSTAEVRLVCSACGTIVEEYSSLTVMDTEGTSYVSNNGSFPQTPLKPLRYNHRTVPPGQKQGLEKIMQLASVFYLPQNMKDSAKQLFSKAYKNPEFLKKSIKKKLVLGGCCVYVVLRQCHRPVLPNDLCQYLQCKPKQFYAVYKDLEKFREKFDKRVKEQTTEEFVRAVLRDMKIDDKEKLIRKTVEIVNACYQCWLMSGRTRPPSVIAAAYVAWVSSDYSCSKTKFSKFYSMHPFPKEMQRTAASRLNDIYSVFIKHAEELPWLKNSADVNHKNIFLHVDHVLRCFKSLHKSVLSAEKTSSNCDMDVLGYEKFRPESAKRSKRINGSGDGVSSEMTSNVDSYNDEDISDTEIEKYIRTEKEVADFLQFQRKVEGKRSDKSSELD